MRSESELSGFAEEENAEESGHWQPILYGYFLKDSFFFAGEIDQEPARPSDPLWWHHFQYSRCRGGILANREWGTCTYPVPVPHSV